jgi:nitroreductase
VKKFIGLKEYNRIPENEMLVLSQIFYQKIQKRRSVREFSREKINIEIIYNCIKAANSAPSGANKQPWHYVVVTDEIIKSKIRIEAEKEERAFYGKKATDEWLKDLEPFETDENKPFLEDAPILIAIFEEKYSIDSQNVKHKNYYTKESVGISAGILITALHNSGLVTLTHTPSPMNFLNEILKRPLNEKPFLLLVVGYPAENTKVPDITRKSLDEIMTVL